MFDNIVSTVADRAKRHFDNHDKIIGNGKAKSTLKREKPAPQRVPDPPRLRPRRYEAATHELEATSAPWRGKLTEVIAILKRIDDSADTVDERNKVMLGTLTGALRNKPEAAMLKQITGPTTRRKTPTAL